MSSTSDCVAHAAGCRWRLASGVCLEGLKKTSRSYSLLATRFDEAVAGGGHGLLDQHRGLVRRLRRERLHDDMRCFPALRDRPDWSKDNPAGKSAVSAEGAALGSGHGSSGSKILKSPERQDNHGDRQQQEPTATKTAFDHDGFCDVLQSDRQPPIGDPISVRVPRQRGVAPVISPEDVSGMGGERRNSAYNRGGTRMHTRSLAPTAVVAALTTLLASPPQS